MRLRISAGSISNGCQIKDFPRDVSSCFNRTVASNAFVLKDWPFGLSSSFTRRLVFS